MKIDLSRIEDEPQAFAGEIAVDQSRLDADRVVEPMVVRLEGTVRSAAGRFLVSGRGQTKGRLNCSRCLSELEWQMDAPFTVELALAEAAPLDSELALGEEDLDVVYLEEPFLDLEELAVEQVLLELPMRVLCSEDCAGLCPTCGADRNQEGACRCEPETDPRWAVLKDVAGRPQDN